MVSVPSVLIIRANGCPEAQPNVRSLYLIDRLLCANHCIGSEQAKILASIWLTFWTDAVHEKRSVSRFSRV